MGKNKLIANTVRVFYNATNTEKMKPEERFLPIQIDGAGDTFVFHPLGPKYELKDVKKVVEGSGARVTVKNKEWVWQTKVENKVNWLDVPLGVWRTWNAVGMFRKLFTRTGEDGKGYPVLVTEQDMFKKSHGDLEKMDASLREKMDMSRMLDEQLAAKQAKAEALELKLQKLAAQQSGSPTAQS